MLDFSFVAHELWVLRMDLRTEKVFVLIFQVHFNSPVFPGSHTRNGIAAKY